MFDQKKLRDALELLSTSTTYFRARSLGLRSQLVLKGLDKH